MRRAALLVATVLLGLTACTHAGSGPEDADKGNTSFKSGKDTTTTTIRFTGDAGSPFCLRLKDLDTNDVLSDEGRGPAQVEAGLTTLRQVLVDTAALAPKELRKDITSLADGIKVLDDALSEVGYSYDELAKSPNALEVSAAVNDPAFTEAAVRLTTYKAQVCHL